MHQRKIETESCSIFDIKISPSQDSFAAALIEAPVKVFAIATGAELLSISDAYGDSAWTVDWSAVDNNLFLFAGYGTSGYVKIFDSEGKSVLSCIKQSKDFGSPDAAQLHSNSIWRIKVIDNVLYTVSDDCKMFRTKLLWNGTYFEYNRSTPKCLDCSFVDRYYEFIQWNNNFGLLASEAIFLVNLKTMKIEATFKGHLRKVISLAKIDSERFISSSWDNTLKIWDFNTGEIVKNISLQETVYKVLVVNNRLFHSEGHLIFERDVATFDIIQSYDFHKYTVKTFDITSDGKIMISGDDNGVVFVSALR
jgi:WD40 repeat protein